mmetsp:Transcript_10960/g.22331  ORF Transcript_10960/g.22331 Transcript_10960/m.22331 type:complete len:468 (+) Transcript_10960:276-1679(+)
MRPQPLLRVVHRPPTPRRARLPRHRRLARTRPLLRRARPAGPDFQAHSSPRHGIRRGLSRRLRPRDGIRRGRSRRAERLRLRMSGDCGHCQLVRGGGVRARDGDVLGECVEDHGHLSGTPSADCLAHDRSRCPGMSSRLRPSGDVQVGRSGLGRISLLRMQEVSLERLLRSRQLRARIEQQRLGMDPPRLLRRNPRSHHGSHSGPQLPRLSRRILSRRGLPSRRSRLRRIHRLPMQNGRQLPLLPRLRPGTRTGRLAGMGETQFLPRDRRPHRGSVLRSRDSRLSRILGGRHPLPSRRSRLRLQFHIRMRCSLPRALHLSRTGHRPRRRIVEQKGKLRRNHRPDLDAYARSRLSGMSRLVRSEHSLRRRRRRGSQRLGVSVPHRCLRGLLQCRAGVRAGKSQFGSGMGQIGIVFRDHCSDVIADACGARFRRVQSSLARVGSRELCGGSESGIQSVSFRMQIGRSFE